MKRVFIIHGWEGHPREGWFPWLKKELEERGFKVFVPAMPETGAPKIKPWVSHISELVGDADEDTYFVSHSIGCQAVMRFLEGLPEGKKVGGVVLVAGWFVLDPKESEEEKKIAKPWLETPIDFEMIKMRTKNIYSVFSDDDDVIPPENKELIEKNLGAKTFLEHGKGHFSGGDNITELPVVLNLILDMVK
jgi:predicted alpha/beta hydrolase family esterase